MASAGRPPEKQREIADAVRARIVAGELAPGDRLPPRAELARRFAAGPDTVQRALDGLRGEGFVVAHGRRGTFVAPHPPHRHCYGLVTRFSDAPRGPRRLWLSHTMMDAARAASRPERRFACYFGVDGRPDAEDAHRLDADLAAGRLAGAVFLEAPHHLADTPLIQREGVARVAIAAGALGEVPAVGLAGFFERAVEHLLARGCRRLAMIRLATQITETHTGHGHEEALAQLLRPHRLVPPPHRLHGIHPEATEEAYRVAQLLARLPAHDRPDGLIVSDSAFVDPATRGLFAAGVRVPEEIAVVAHCNYPALPRAATPVRFLGYSADELLTRCCAAIDAQHAGETPDVSRVSALFPEELETPQHVTSVQRSTG